MFDQPAHVFERRELLLGGILTAVLALASCTKRTHDVSALPPPVPAATLSDDKALRAACGEDRTRCPEYRAALEGMCSSGDADVCGRLAALVAVGTGGPEDKVRARELASDACKAGSKFGCSNTAVFAMRGWGGSRDLQEAYRAATRSCRDGLDVGCINLSDVLHEDELSIDPAERVEALELACEGYAAGACETLANELIALGEDGRLEEDARPMLRGAVLRLCQIGSAGACDYFVDLVRAGIGGSTDEALLDRAARRACSLGRQARCASGTSPRPSPVRVAARVMKASDGGDHLDHLGQLEEAWSPCAEKEGRNRFVKVQIVIAPHQTPDLQVDGPQAIVDCMTEMFPWRDGDPMRSDTTIRFELWFQLADPQDSDRVDVVDPLD